MIECLPGYKTGRRSLTSVVEHAVHDDCSIGDRLCTIVELYDTVRDIDHRSAGRIAGQISEITHMSTSDIVGASAVRPV